MSPTFSQLAGSTLTRFAKLCSWGGSGSASLIDLVPIMSNLIYFSDCYHLNQKQSNSLLLSSLLTVLLLPPIG